MMVQPTPTTVEVNGFALREIRVRSGIGMGPCAELAGISQGYLSRIELGQRPRVSPQVLAGLMRAVQLRDRRAILMNPLGATDSGSEGTSTERSDALAWDTSSEDWRRPLG